MTGQKWPLIAELPEHQQRAFRQWLRIKYGHQGDSYCPLDYAEWSGSSACWHSAAAHSISADGQTDAQKR